MRSKIIEFRQQEYITEIKEPSSRLEFSNIEKANLEGHAQSLSLRLEGELSKLCFELSEATKKYASEQTNLSFARKIKEEDAQKLIQELQSTKYQLQAKECDLMDIEAFIQARSKQIIVFDDEGKEKDKPIAQVIGRRFTRSKLSE